MEKNWGWIGRGLVALVAAVVLGAPQFAEARQRCDNEGNSRRNVQDYRYNGSRGNYRESRSDYGRYQNSGYGYNNSGYNNRGYNNSGYNNGYYNDGYYNDGYGTYQEPRSAGKSAAIIGGSAAAGALVGGLSGGTKGAIIGAAVGGVGGLVYDRATRYGDRRW
jgi:hypothetical protein